MQSRNNVQSSTYGMDLEVTTEVNNVTTDSVEGDKRIPLLLLEWDMVAQPLAICLSVFGVLLLSAGELHLYDTSL